MTKTEKRRPMTLHRRSQIADLTRENGVMRVGELAERFGVSTVTIRNDLMELERGGQLIRDHGGAMAAESDSGKTISSLLEFEARTQLRVAEKQRIGAAAARLIENGDSILLDAGTTVVETARHLSTRSGLTVVTNALNIAYHVGTTTDAHLIVLGGTLNREAASTLGPLTEHGLGELVVGKLFLGAQAMSLDDGITDTTMEIAGVKRAMIRAARQVILLADSSKWGRAGFIKVAPLSEIHIIISDDGLPAEARAEITRAGIELILV